MAPVSRVIVGATLLLLVSTTALAGTVTGTVIAAATRQPLAGMAAAAYDAAGSLRGTATTDATGLYVLTLPAGTYRVLAYDANGVYATMFDGNAESFETSPAIALGATDSVRVDFALVRGGRVTGIILAPDGSAVANAVVTAYNLSGTRRGFTTTNAQGSYSLVLPPGPYKIVAFDDAGRYAAAFYREARHFAAANVVTVIAEQTATAIDIRLGVAALVTGNVVDAATGLPLASIFVYAYSEAGVLVSGTTTDANGAFRFALPAGRYRFVAGDPVRTYAPGFLSGKRSFATADVIELSAGQVMSAVQFGLTRGGVLAGRVTDGSGAPLGGITVAAYNVDGTEHTSVRTGTDGRFEMVVAPGEVKLAAFDTTLTYATDYYSGRTSFVTADVVRVTAGQRVTNFDFVLRRGGRISGTVTDGVTNQLLGGIVVAAYDANGLLTAQAITAPNGTYALVVPPGAYRVLAFDPQLRYATRYDGGAKSFQATTARDAVAGTTATVNFALFRGVKVTGTVVDASGRALTGIEIVVLDAAGNHVASSIATGGAFAIVVPADNYRFVAHDPSGRFVESSKTLAVGEGQSPQIAFVLTGAARRRAARH